MKQGQYIHRNLYTLIDGLHIEEGPRDYVKYDTKINISTFSSKQLNTQKVQG